MKILIPTAGQEAAEDIATYMMKVARRMSASVVAVHILRDGESETEGQHACDVFLHAGNDIGVDVVSKVISGGVVEAIIAAASESSASLILMGASRGTVVDNWLSADVMQKCDIPVLVVPHCYGNQPA